MIIEVAAYHCPGRRREATENDTQALHTGAGNKAIRSNSQSSVYPLDSVVRLLEYMYSAEQW